MTPGAPHGTPGAVFEGMLEAVQQGAAAEVCEEHFDEARGYLEEALVIGARLSGPDRWAMRGHLPPWLTSTASSLMTPSPCVRKGLRAGVRERRHDHGAGGSGLGDGLGFGVGAGLTLCFSQSSVAVMFPSFHVHAIF